MSSKVLTNENIRLSQRRPTRPVRQPILALLGRTECICFSRHDLRDSTYDMDDIEAMDFEAAFATIEETGADSGASEAE